MTSLTTFPEWENIAECLRIKLGYSDATILRTSYTYNAFVSDYCILEGGDADSICRMVLDELMNNIKMVLFHGKELRFMEKNNSHNESILASYINCEQTQLKHAESIINRDENLVRQYILFAEENGKDIEDMDIQGILDFLSHMKKLRPAGLKSTVSALKHFYLFMIDMDLIDEHHLCVSYSNKTQKAVSVPFSSKTGDAIADYILNACGKSELPYIYLKESYFDSAMTSSLLYTRINKYLKTADINHPK